MKKLLIVMAVAAATASTVGCCNGRSWCRRNTYATACPPPGGPCSTGAYDADPYAGGVYSAPPSVDYLPGPVAN
ncbi:MAG: hypothetical protein BMS9Abin04_083 [Planctomycetia bacterium]|nr:MAG: hypothetical protein BMS9Abin04_083 [Planctomycetia bacterium]